MRPRIEIDKLPPPADPVLRFVSPVAPANNTTIRAAEAALAAGSSQVPKEETAELAEPEPIRKARLRAGRTNAPQAERESDGAYKTVGFGLALRDRELLAEEKQRLIRAGHRVQGFADQSAIVRRAIRAYLPRAKDAKE